jgi:hypothetical protein
VRSKPREGRQSACHRREPVGSDSLMRVSKPPIGGDRFARTVSPLAGLWGAFRSQSHWLTPVARRLPPLSGAKIRAKYRLALRSQSITSDNQCTMLSANRRLSQPEVQQRHAAGRRERRRFPPTRTIAPSPARRALLGSGAGLATAVRLTSPVAEPVLPDGVPLLSM